MLPHVGEASITAQEKNNMNAYVTGQSLYVPSFAHNNARKEIVAKIANDCKVSEQTAAGIVSEVLKVAKVSNKAAVTRNVAISREEMARMIVELGAAKEGPVTARRYKLDIGWDELNPNGYVWTGGGNEAKGIAANALLPKEEFDRLNGTTSTGSTDPV